MVTITSTAKHHGQKVDKDGWQHNAYQVTLHLHDDDKTYDLEVPYRMGLGLQGPPTTADVLWSLASDALTIIDGSTFLRFEEWAEECGYDPDSRSAEKVWNDCRRQTFRMGNWWTRGGEPYSFRDLLRDVVELDEVSGLAGGQVRAVYVHKGGEQVSVDVSQGAPTETS